MANDLVIDVHGLNKSFAGKKAVIDLSLQVRRGEIFGFLGPNGSGKTTTIRMLCGLMTPDSGQGECLGYNIITQSALIKPLVGYVPQAFSLYKDLTVRENLEFIARVYTVPAYAERTKEIMAELGLDRYQDILAGRLSGGWKQRLSLGAALIHNPKLLLLDEPTAGVDPKARREFWDDIAQLTTRGITSLVSTHYMDEAERCNRLAYIVYGRLMAEGTVSEIIDQVHLTTFAAKGAHLAELRQAIEGYQGVEQVTVFGQELRVSGMDPVLLKQAIASFPNYAWQQVPTSLEEVFIHFVSEQDTEGNA